MQKKNQITPSDRDAFVPVPTLIHQAEKKKVGLQVNDKFVKCIGKEKN